MRRLISLLFMVAVAAMSHAAWVADTDSSSNVMTVKVMPAKDLKKVPVSVSLANSLPITCVQCFVATPDTADTFCYIYEADKGDAQKPAKDRKRKGVAYDRTERWAATHQALLSWNTKSCPGTMMALIASPLNESFAGSDGAVLTIYFDASQLGEGEHSIKMMKANVSWTNGKEIKTFYSPDMEARFLIKDGAVMAVE